MSAAGLRKGWCPGALRPMLSGDGLIVRLRLSCGELPMRMASAIAELAALYGNGGIDLTQRANLQLRGVREASLPSLTESLDDLGLIDASPEAEAVRNVTVSPLAGLDPACRDGRALARALEERLSRDAALHALPAKFGFAIDGGGRWPLGATGADVALCADDAEGPWRIRLAGADLLSEPVEGSQATEALARVAQVFLRNGLRRMRDLVAQDGAQGVLERAGFASEPPRSDIKKVAQYTPGVHQVSRTGVIAAVGLPFGRIEAVDLAALTGACEPESVLRLTPWRMLLVPFSDEAAASMFVANCGALGLIISAGDPRAFIDACTGAPGCINATTGTRHDAARLASRFPQLFTTPNALHVSGCAKGCALRGPARFTLVAREGRYDLIRNGAPGDAPHRTGIASADLAAALMAAEPML